MRGRRVGSLEAPARLKQAPGNMERNDVLPVPVAKRQKNGFGMRRWFQHILERVC